MISVGARASMHVPGAVALGGSIAALYCQHRVSTDIDFVLTDLRERFDDIRELLYELPDWKEARIQRPVLILGSLTGVEIGYRQLRRSVPLQTREVVLPEGVLVIPTLDEMILIKAFLIQDRNATRDFVDFAELTTLEETARVVEWLSGIDKKFGWEKRPSFTLDVLRCLHDPVPGDLDKYGFDQLRLLRPRLKTWEDVKQQCGEIGAALALSLLDPERETP